MRARGGLNSMAGYRAVAGLLTGPLKSSRCIVYCLFQWHADEMSKALYVAGVQCVSYHAGMGTRDRAEVQVMPQRREGDDAVGGSAVTGIWEESENAGRDLGRERNVKAEGR